MDKEPSRTVEGAQDKDKSLYRSDFKANKLDVEAWLITLRSAWRGAVGWGGEVLHTGRAGSNTYVSELHTEEQCLLYSNGQSCESPNVNTWWK